MTQKEDLLYRYAYKFREALAAEVAKRNSAGVQGKFLTEFPRAACQDSCRLLAHYLRSKGVGPLRQLWGYRLPNATPAHAWLEHRGIIIDITADQFPEIHQPVIATLDRSWHRHFKTHVLDGPEVRYAFYDRLRSDIRGAYEEVYRSTIALIVD